MRNIVNIVGTSLLTAMSIHAQGTFQNLDFEQGNPGPVEFAQDVPVATVLPDWSAYYGNVQQTDVGYNVITTGATQISLVGGSQFHIDGDYSASLQAGPSTASISQTGVIPAGAQTLLFEANYSGPAEVLIGGQNVPFSQVGSGPNYGIFGANVSAWSGQTEQLTFTLLTGGDGPSPNYWVLDDISFSTSVVPEPNPIVLMGIAGLLFALCRRFAICQKHLFSGRSLTTDSADFTDNANPL